MMAPGLGRSVALFRAPQGVHSDAQHKKLRRREATWRRCRDHATLRSGSAATAAGRRRRAGRGRRRDGRHAAAAALVGVSEGVAVGLVPAPPPVLVEVGVSVGVPVACNVGVPVTCEATVGVEVTLGTSVDVGIGVDVGASVEVASGAAVGTGVGFATPVAVGVGITVGHELGVPVGVGVTVLGAAVLLAWAVSITTLACSSAGHRRVGWCGRRGRRVRRRHGCTGRRSLMGSAYSSAAAYWSEYRWAHRARTIQVDCPNIPGKHTVVAAH